MPRLAFFTGFFLSVLLLACEKTPEKIISINPSEFTTAQQIKIGNAFKNEIESNPQAFEILKKQEFPEAYQYLTSLFNTIVNTAAIKHRRDYDWPVYILKNDTMRTAFFLPGGHFYVYTGLLKHLDRESQLIGVIGHELYYVDSDVLIKKMSSEFGGTTLGDIILDNEVEKLANLAASMPLISFDETQVLEADSFATSLICPFQYEPHGIKTILEMENSTGPDLLWLVTRKATIETRIRRLEQQASLCGFPGVSNEIAYRKFTDEYLP
jgi:beta-barrel assembly-enhancing protease